MHANQISGIRKCDSGFFRKKKGHPQGQPFWCERWDSNPHGETTRTSNVLVYHSNTLASDLSIITCSLLFVNNFFLPMEAPMENRTIRSGFI